MNTIEHNNVFELLSVDMDIPHHEIKDILISKGTKEFVGYLKKCDLWIHKTDLILSSEIKDSFGKVLINKGIPLNKYLTSLLERYVKDDKFSTSPFFIECTDDVLKMYRGKSYDKINTILDNHIYTKDTYALLFDSNPLIKDSFKNVVDEILTTPKGICTMLRILGGFSDYQDSISNSINSAFITLALSSYSCNKSMETSSTLANKAGIACLLQNITEIAGDHLCDSSAVEIIRTLVNDETLEQAVAMHQSATYESAPIFSDQVNRTNYYLRVMVTVSLFVDLVYQNKTNAQNLEVHKSLYELADNGYADKEVAAILGKMFLPEAKYLILEYAYKIKGKCINFPVIWSTVGDMLPVKFLCTTDSCQNAGSHKTFIPKDVNITSSGKTSTSVPAGLYYTCNLLTNDLQHYYKSIVRHKD